MMKQYKYYYVPGRLSGDPTIATFVIDNNPNFHPGRLQQQLHLFFENPVVLSDINSSGNTITTN
jgi:hypothetical protein